MKKNVYRTNEIKFLNGAKFTRYDVDVETLSEEDDWKNYKRMELNPGDMIHLSDGTILKVVKDKSYNEICGTCAIFSADSELGHKIGRPKESALCMMCDCVDMMHLEEVNE